MSNAVNLTDGLDGLATGTSILVIGSYMAIAFWQYRHWCATPSTHGNYCYDVRDPLEMALIAGAAAGALLRLPVVEHVTGAHLHGRHRLHGARLADRRARRGDEDRAAAAADGPAVLHHRRHLDHADRLVPHDRQDASSGWCRCSTTSSWPAGARSTSWSGSGSSPGIGMAASLGLFAADFLRVMSGPSRHASTPTRRAARGRRAARVRRHDGHAGAPASMTRRQPDRRPPTAAPAPPGSGRSARFDAAARPARPAARLLLPAAVQRRAAGPHRPGDGVLGDQRRARTPQPAARSPRCPKQPIFAGGRPRRVLGLPAAAGAHVPGRWPPRC